MLISEEIARNLRAEFSPSVLDVVDVSESHRGHGGWREGGQTHFNIKIVASTFASMNRITRHRAVYAALTPDLVGRVHALTLDISG